MYNEIQYKADNDNFKVINKGADITIITGIKTSELAMKASRTLVVKGISTAVIEVINLNSISEEAILKFVKRTKALVLTEKWLYNLLEKLLEQELGLVVEVLEDCSVESIIRTTIEVINKKRK